jgi:adenylate cyclase
MNLAWATIAAIGLVAAGALAAGLAAGLHLALRKSRLGADLAETRLKAAQNGLEALQQAFSKFAPAEMIEDIITRGVSTRSEKKDVTILFADLQGFTSMSENMDPAELVEILNGYFHHVSEAINAHRGHVNKFIGDGLLATFGALEPNPWQHNDSCHAALAMRAALERYNLDLASKGWPQLKIGVGIHRGIVVAGVIGSDQLMEYTVIGAAVNLASRVESLTRKQGVDILITEAVRAGLDTRFKLEEKPPMEVKGVSEPVGTYALEAYIRATASLKRDTSILQPPA